MNLFKKIRFYLQFRRTIRKNRDTLFLDFNIRVDFADRLYTVVNVPDTLGDPYNIRKADIDRVSEVYLKDYISKLGTYLNSLGLSEMYGYYQPIKKLDKFSYLVVIGYKPLLSTRISTIFWYFILPAVVISTSYCIYQLFS